MRPAPVLVTVLLVVLAGCVGGFGLSEVLPGGDGLSCDVDFPARPAGGDGPADPSRDVLGWEGGLWYNESITVDQSDGLNCDELALVVARTMARVERIRHLEFTETPDVSIVPRDAFTERLSGGGPDVPEERRAFQNVKYEALFMVNESADAIAVLRRNRGASVSAFYSPRENAIVLVTEGERLRVNGGVLAHELTHALQDQHFNARRNSGLEDVANAHLGLTEGDANYVEYLYERRCDDEWRGTCLLPGEIEAGEMEERSDSGGSLANVGTYLISYQPYSDGPAFVRQIRKEGGWEAVNALYRDPPESTEQTIHPRKYGTDRPTSVELADTSTDRFSRITPPDQLDHERWGEAALFSMFLNVYYDSEGRTTIVPLDSFLARDEPNESSALDPYNYSSPYSAGWDGDRLVAYANGGGEYAYVWKLAFDSNEDAREFLEGYREVLRYRGAERVDGRRGVWVIPEDEPFADAFYVTRTEETVVIVNAPTVEGLSEVRPPATRGARDSA